MSTAAPSAAVDCPACEAALPVSPGSEHAVCPACGRAVRVLVFPALFRPIPLGVAAMQTASAAEATCYNHPGSVAVVPCSRCGRFLCSLCDIEHEGAHLCPACFPAAGPSGFSGLDSERILWDSVALSTALLSFLFWYITLITAPIVLVLVVRKWKAPPGPIPRTRVRLVLAAAVALLQLAGWGLLLTIGFVALRRA